MELEVPCSQLVAKFVEAKKNQNRYGISCVDHHVFIRLPRAEQLFWSPQLHLEFNETSENRCNLHGFFGPNPTVWTMFIFFHVVVGTLFLANLVWLYSNWSLGEAYKVQLIIAFGLILLWGILYLAGSVGKEKGKTGMRALHEFMLQTINLSIDTSQSQELEQNLDTIL